MEHVPTQSEVLPVPEVIEWHGDDALFIFFGIRQGSQVRESGRIAPRYAARSSALARELARSRELLRLTCLAAGESSARADGLRAQCRGIAQVIISSGMR